MLDLIVYFFQYLFYRATRPSRLVNPRILIQTCYLILQGYADELADLAADGCKEFAKFAEELDVHGWLVKCVESTENKELQTDEVKDTLRYTVREVGPDINQFDKLLVLSVFNEKRVVSL